MTYDNDLCGHDDNCILINNWKIILTFVLGIVGIGSIMTKLSKNQKNKTKFRASKKWKDFRDKKRKEQVVDPVTRG